MRGPGGLVGENERLERARVLGQGAGPALCVEIAARAQRLGRERPPFGGAVADPGARGLHHVEERVLRGPVREAVEPHAEGGIVEAEAGRLRVRDGRARRVAQPERLDDLVGDPGVAGAHQRVQVRRQVEAGRGGGFVKRRPGDEGGQEILRRRAVGGVVGIERLDRHILQQAGLEARKDGGDRQKRDLRVGAGLLQRGGEAAEPVVIIRERMAVPAPQLARGGRKAAEKPAHVGPAFIDQDARPGPARARRVDGGKGGAKRRGAVGVPAVEGAVGGLILDEVGGGEDHRVHRAARTRHTVKRPAVRHAVTGEIAQEAPLPGGRERLAVRPGQFGQPPVHRRLRAVGEVMKEAVAEDMHGARLCLGARGTGAERASRQKAEHGDDLS